MAPLWKKPPSEFRLTYGVPIPDHRSGGVTKSLEEGFKTHSLEKSPYRYMLEVVASSEKVYPLFESLSALCGAECMSLLEVHEGENVTTYESTAFGREKILGAFGSHAFQLVHDGYTGFGVASPYFEVFVTDHKDLRIYSNSLTEVERILKSSDLRATKRLALLGSGPHYHIPIGAFFNSELSKFAESLPQQEIEKYSKGSGAYEAFRQDIISRLEMSMASKVQS